MSVRGRPVDRYADAQHLVHSPSVRWEPTQPAALPPAYLEAVARYLEADEETPAQQHARAPRTVPGACTGAHTVPPAVTSHTKHPRHDTHPDITPGQSSHGSTHAMHAAGALTLSPPSVQGGE